MQAQALLPLCRAHDATFIINDDIKLCLAIDADGVHLGVGDFDARRIAVGIDLALHLQAGLGRGGGNQLDDGSCLLRIALRQMADQRRSEGETGAVGLDSGASLAPTCSRSSSPARASADSTAAWSPRCSAAT